MVDRVYRAEVVGSLLRPSVLVEARRAMRAGELSPEEYRLVEDRAVDGALRLQEDAGVDVVTDGELRRDIFFDFFVAGLGGLSMVPGHIVRFRSRESEDAMSVTVPFTVTERIRAKPCPGLEELLYARERTTLPLKVTLPSPLLISGFWNDRSRDAYADPFELMADAAEVVKGWIRELAAAGCRYVQIDAPELAEAFADERVRAEHAARGIDPDRFLHEGTELIGEVAQVGVPDGILALHVCKGNGTQSWIAEGGYEEFARHVFVRASGFDVFLLEYDDERSGSFEPLRELPDDKVAVLGLVSTKWTALEEPDELVRRIDDAARFYPKERLALSTQCGFASAAETAEQRKISEETQEQKLRLVAEIAARVWTHA